jgi:hypothetical protein
MVALMNLKNAVGVCYGPFVLDRMDAGGRATHGAVAESKVEAWTAYNTLTRWVIEKSRSPFDSLRTNGIFQNPTALFRMTISRIRILSYCLLTGLAIATTTARAEPKTNTGDNTAIKKAQGMIRQLSQENMALQAEKVAWLNEKAALENRLAAMRNEVGKLQGLPAEVERYKAGLAAIRTDLESRLGQQRQREQALVQKHNDVVRKAKAIQGDNQLLVQAVREREQWITQCSDLNQKLRGANREVINQYKDKGLLQQLAELDPLTGIARVETESVAEDYRYKLQQLTVTPFQATEPAAAGQALERSAQPAAETQPDVGEALDQAAGSP